MMMNLPTVSSLALLLLIVVATTTTVEAFSSSASSVRQTSLPLARHPYSSSVSSSSSTSPTALKAAAVANPFKKLPWNVRKDQERASRRLKMERAQLHRELGIPEDATYEEIVAATDSLIAKAGGDLKKKVKVEIAKDKILQIRLNERLAGLAQTTKEAKAQSTFEYDGADEDDDDVAAKKQNEWNAPLWTRGLIVKPDQTHLKNQVRLWGIITAIGAALPPAQDYLGRFTWLICVAQLTFRGMPREAMDRGGMGMNFSSSGGGGHRKVAFGLGFLTWIVGATVVYGLMPAWAKGQRWTPTLAFTMQNFVFGVVSCYLQPYKG